MDEQQLMGEMQRARQLQQRAQQISAKLVELRHELVEHDRVRTTLMSVRDRETRTCYRLQGEALVQRSVEGTITELDGEIIKIQNIITTLEKQRTEAEDMAREIVKKAQPGQVGGKSTTQASFA